MCGTAARVQRNMERRFQRSVWSQSSSLISHTRALRAPPTTFTRMSIRPKRSAAVSMRRWAMVGSVTSPTTPTKLAPVPVSAVSVRFRIDPSMSPPTTRAPSAASRSATARPMPCPAPVTTATRPSTRPAIVLGLQTDRARHALEMQRRVAEIQARRLDALVKEVEGVLLAVADGAEDLVGAARHRQARLAAVGLRDGAVGRGRTSFTHRPGRGVEEAARAVDVAHEVGARVLDRLVTADGPAALHTRLGVLHRDLEDLLGGAHHLRGAGERARL